MKHIGASLRVITSCCVSFRGCNEVQQLCQLPHLPERTAAQHSAGESLQLCRLIQRRARRFTKVKTNTRHRHIIKPKTRGVISSPNVNLLLSFINCLTSVSHQALWMMEPKEISDWQHEEFYRYVAQAYDKPRYTLHYRADAPLNIRSIFYVPDAVRSSGLGVFVHTHTPMLWW